MGVLDVILDILILLLPMPSLYKLQMPLHRKIAVVATFALGLFTIVASVMRLVAVIDIDFTSKNFNQSQVSDIYWCAIENSVGIIVACAMLLRPLLDRIHDVFGRYRSRWLEMKASRRRATNEGSTGNLVKTADEDSFMRLHDSQELVIATILEGKGDVRDDYTRRASYENV